MRNKIRCVTGY